MAMKGKRVARGLNDAAQESAKKITESRGLKRERNNSARPSAENGRKVFASRTPDKQGKVVRVSDLKRFLNIKKDNNISNFLLPEEITVKRFITVLEDVLTEKIKENELCTTSGILGACWERLALDFPQVKDVMHTALKDGSLDLLHEFVAVHLRTKKRGFGGFLNGKGEFISLDAIADDAKMESQALRVRLASKIAEVKSKDNREKFEPLDKLMKEMGIVYTRNWAIDGQAYKDGVFLMRFGNHWIWLTDAEFKTAGSKGVHAQSSTVFARLAGASTDSVFSFKNEGGNGVKIPPEIPLDKILFNPIDLNSHVAVKQGRTDYGDFVDPVDIASTRSVKEKIRSQTRERKKRLSEKRTQFEGDLKSLTSSIYKAGIGTDLTGMRRFIFELLESVE